MKSVSFEEFKKLDIRIGEVVKAEVPKWSHWVIKLTVDFASEAKSSKNRSSRRVRPRPPRLHLGAAGGIKPKSREVRSGGEKEIGRKIIFAGLLGFYNLKDLEGKQFPFIVNLEPKKIGPESDYSEGMMLAASLELDKAVKIAGEKLVEKPILITPEEKVSPGTKIR